MTIGVGKFERLGSGQAASHVSVPGKFFPSYVSFDDFIDVQRLRSLDSYLATVSDTTSPKIAMIFS